MAAREENFVRVTIVENYSIWCDDFSEKLALSLVLRKL